MFNQGIRSTIEFHRWLLEQNIALFINLSISKTAKLLLWVLTVDIVFVQSTLFNLLKLDLSDCFLFFKVQVGELGSHHILFLVKVIDLHFPFEFLKSSSFLDFFKFKIPQILILLSLDPQIFFSSLPDLLRFLLCNYLEPSSLRFNELLMLFQPYIIIFCDGLVHAGHIWGDAIATSFDDVFNLKRVGIEGRLSVKTQVCDCNSGCPRESSCAMNINPMLLIYQMI